MSIIPKNGPVSVSLVKQVLGTSDNSVVRLCSNAEGKINRFALRRPVVHSTLGDITDEQRKTARLGWEFDGGGANAQGYLTPTGLQTAIRNSTACSAKFPDGTYPTEPCRLGDFRGYDSAAAEFVPAAPDVKFDSNPDTQSHDFFKNQLVISQDEGLHWWDVYHPDGAYPCIVVFKPGGGYVWKTAPTKFGGTSPWLTLNASEVPGLMAGTNGDYDYMLCACTKQKETMTTTDPGGARFLPIPCNPVNAMLGKLSYSLMIKSLKVEILGVLGATALTAGTAKTFLSASTYMGFISAGGASNFLNVGQTGKLALLVKFTNESTGQVRSTTYIRFTASNTLNGSTTETPRVFAVTGSGLSVTIGQPFNITALNPLKVNPQSSLTVALDFASLMTGGATVAKGLTASPRLGLLWSDVDAANVHMLPTNMLRVTSGT